jgi:hypothetical protein
VAQNNSLNSPTTEEISRVARRIAADALAEALAQLADADTYELFDVLGELIEEHDSANPEPVSDVAGKLIDAVLGQRPEAFESPSESATGSASLIRYELVVETDNEPEVERLSDELEQLACPLNHGQSGPDEACRLPWFLTVVYLDNDDEETADLRSMLNR